MFSAAAARGPDLAAAVRDAAGRAKDGLLGALDFAVVAAAGFAARRGGGGGSADDAGVEALLAGELGADVPVLGVWGEGVMGADGGGSPAEHEGRFADGGGAVVVVLGRVPGVCVVPFAGGHAPAAARRAQRCNAGARRCRRRRARPTAARTLRPIPNQLGRRRSRTASTTR
jgi:hypothetical protein